MKRVLSLILSLSLTLTFSIPAGAQSTAEFSWGEVETALADPSGFMGVGPQAGVALLLSGGDVDALVKSIAQSIAKDLIKGFINDFAPEMIEGAAVKAAESAGLTADSSIGGTVLLIAQIIISLDAFFDADTDRGRVYAAVDMIVAIVAACNAVVGAIVWAVVMVIKLIDAGVSASLARKMMRIYARIAKYYEQSKVLQTALVKAEQARFVTLFEQMKKSMDRLNVKQDFLTKKCTDETYVNSIFRLDLCMKATVQIYAENRRMISLMDELINAPTSYIQVDKLFKQQGKSREEFETLLADYRTGVEKMKPAIDGSMEKYSKAASALMLIEAAVKSGRPTVEEEKSSCLRYATYLTLMAGKVLMPQNQTEIEPMGNKAVGNAEQVISAIDDFYNEGCFNLEPTGDAELDRIYDKQDKTLQQALGLLLQRTGS